MTDPVTCIVTLTFEMPIEDAKRVLDLDYRPRRRGVTNEGNAAALLADHDRRRLGFIHWSIANVGPREKSVREPNDVSPEGWEIVLDRRRWSCPDCGRPCTSQVELKAHAMLTHIDAPDGND